MTTATDITVEQTEAGGNFIQLEPGTYPAVVANLEVVDNKWEEDKQQIQWTFEVTDGTVNEDGTPASKLAWSNMVYNSSSKLWKWTAAITGETPTAGEPFRSSLVLGKPCRIFINQEPSKTTGELVMKVKDVLGPEKKAAPKRPGLAARLREEQPEAVNQDIGDCIVCDSPGTAFTSRGKPVCEAHRGVG